MPSSVRNAATRAAPDAEADAASAASRSTARAPVTVSRAIAASRLTAFAAARSAISASICLEEEALMAIAGIVQRLNDRDRGIGSSGIPNPYRLTAP